MRSCSPAAAYGQGFSAEWMEISLYRQGLSLLCFALLGLGLGLLYDMLRPMRYAGGRACIWDGLFCAVAAAGLFVLSMGSGRLGQWDMAAALLMFCVYINLLSPHILPIFLGIAETMHKSYKIIILWLKKIKINAKKFFTNGSE